MHYHLPIQSVSPATISCLKSHEWPGNIRELENLAKRITVFGAEESITDKLRGHNIVPDFPPQILKDGCTSLKEITAKVVKQVERKIILSALEANAWNSRQTARALDISYRTLHYKLKEAGLKLPITKDSSTFSLVGAGRTRSTLN
jgi:two-component system response regulator AtoC